MRMSMRSCMALVAALCVCATYLSISVHATDFVDTRAYDPYFTISSPSGFSVPSAASSLTNIKALPSTVQYVQALWGKNLVSPDGAPSMTLQVVVANPITACTDLINPLNSSWPASDYYAGKIVLTQGGGACVSVVKSRMVQRAGALMNIMVVTSPLAPTYGSGLRGKYAGYATSAITDMASANVDWDIGYTMYQTILANASTPLYITIDSTGPVDPTELAALTTILNGYNYKYYVPAGYVGTQSIANFLNATTSQDPCLYRIIGTKCIGGRFFILDFTSANFVGTWPPEYGVFTKLNYLGFSYNLNLKGPMPCEWGNMASLRAIGIGQTGLTLLSPCMKNMQKLEWLIAAFNPSLTNLPVELLEIKSMSVISFDTSNITAPMLDVTQFPNLTFLDFNQNNIYGSLPNMTKCRSLAKFYMTDAQLSGTIPDGAFDNLPTLLKFDVGRNRLSGPLPKFIGSPNLIEIGVDNNQFTGSIPTTWGKMSSLTAFRGAHNQLSGSFEPIGLLNGLTSIDLSYNQFYTPSPYTTLGDYLTIALPNPIEIVVLSYNKLNGSFTGLTYQTKLKQIYLDHNLMTTMPTSFSFVSQNLASTVTTIDYSYNPYLKGSMPIVNPTSTLQVLKLHGCPLLRDTVSRIPSLPTYITTSTDVLTKLSSDIRYDCPGLTGKNFPLQFSVDPSYYSYQGCSCEQGTYGVPPSCLTIPVYANTTVTTNNPHGMLTDDVYGSSRMSLGIDTAWLLGYTVNPTNSSSSSGSSVVNSTIFISDDSQSDATVKAIYVTFALNDKYFADFDDIIDIYEGGVDLKGARAVSFRGSDSRPLMTNYDSVVRAQGFGDNTFVIFSQYATINFRSRATAGQHFVANFTLSTSCPQGWAFSLDAQKCQIILPVFQLSTSIQYLIWALSALVILLIVVSMVGVLVFRNTVVFKAASVPFCLMILFFACMMAVGSIFYALSAESGTYVCQARLWLTTLSLVGVLSSLLVKANRIRDIFTNNDLIKPVQTNTTLFTTVCIMLVIQLALLIGMSAGGLGHSQLTLGTKSTDGYEVYSCSSVESDGYKVWLSIQIAYIGVFLFFGTYIAFGVRNVPTAFNESSHIVNSLYILTILGVILLPINFIVDDSPNALTAIRGLGQNLVAMSMVLAIFASKFYFIWDGRANDQSMTQTSFAVSKKNTHNEARRGGSRGSGSGGAGKPEDINLKFANVSEQIKHMHELVLAGGTPEEVLAAIRQHVEKAHQITTIPAATKRPVAHSKNHPSNSAVMASGDYSKADRGHGMSSSKRSLGAGGEDSHSQLGVSPFSNQGLAMDKRNQRTTSVSVDTPAVRIHAGRLPSMDENSSPRHSVVPVRTADVQVTVHGAESVALPQSQSELSSSAADRRAGNFI